MYLIILKPTHTFTAAHGCTKKGAEMRGGGALYTTHNNDTKRNETTMTTTKNRGNTAKNATRRSERNSSTESKFESIQRTTPTSASITHYRLAGRVWLLDGDMGLLLDWDGWDCFFFVVSLALGRSVVGLAWLTHNSASTLGLISARSLLLLLPLLCQHNWWIWLFSFSVQFPNTTDDYTTKHRRRIQPDQTQKQHYITITSALLKPHTQLKLWG